MIPLKKNAALKKEYREWFQQHKEELENHFLKFLEKKKDWIKQGYRQEIQGFLFKTSNGKCAYCERIPNEGGGDLQIEHFFPKKKFKQKAFDFDNLLPSCGQCNRAKGENFAINGTEILNPYHEHRFDNHLSLNLETMTISGISDKGNATVTILSASLNTKKRTTNRKIRSGAIAKREEIKTSIDKKLSILLKSIDAVDILFLQVKGLLDMINEKEACTATLATLLFNHSQFENIIASFKNGNPEMYKQLMDLATSKKHFCFTANG